jgi:sortase A
MVDVPVKRRKIRIWLILAVVLFAAGAYLLLTALAPSLPIITQPMAVAVKMQAGPQELKEDRIYIPKIDVDVAIAQGDSEAALEKGAWHRKPQNGNPEKGGNFVLSAHRFEMGFTPQQTRTKSPFYNIDKLQIGDKIYVDYNKKRYTYEVVKKYSVDRFAVAIEAPSDEAKMTLYSCDLRGEAAGREVVEAKPLL